MHNKTLAFIDLETTGLYAGTHEIIECAVIKGQKIFHVYVEPMNLHLATKEAMQINGYSPKQWEGAVSQKYLAHKLADILEDCTIVGHNPKFDLEFIECLFEQHKVPIGIDRRAIDTVTLAWIYLVPRGLKSLSLDSIRSFMGWEVRAKHNALDDARDCKKLYDIFTTLNKYPWYIKHYLKRFFGV